jgi:O-antigen ligase
MEVSQADRFKKNTFLVVLSAVVFGVGVLVLSPILTKNELFLLGLPFVAAAVVVMFLSIRWMFVLLLFTRSLMDPLFIMTQVGTGAGIGGLLNFFVVLLVALYFLRFHRNFKGSRYLVPWGIFLAVCLLTTPYSPMYSQGMKLILNLCTYVGIFVSPFFLVRNLEDKKFWMKILLVSSFLPVGYAVFCVATHRLFPDGRLFGSFAHPNILAFYLVFVITVIFYFLETRIFRLNQIRRILLWMYLLGVLGLLILTQTRSAWISCVGIFFLYGIFKEKKYLVLCLVVSLVLVATPPVQSRLKDLREGTGVRPGEKLNSLSWRVKLWASSIPSIRQKPIFGHGLASFVYYSSDFFDRGRGKVPPHNVYVELLFETGLVGLFSYLWIYWRLLKDLFRGMRRQDPSSSREAAIVFVYIIGYLLICLSDNALYYLAFNWYFWFFIGLVLKSLSLENPDPLLQKEAVA